MSTVKTGWLKNKNGDKFAPKTLTSQITTNDGVDLETKIETEILKAKNDSELYTKSYTDNAISNVQDDIDEIQNALDTKVPISRTVNGQALSANIKLTASDVGASPFDHDHDLDYDTKGSANDVQKNLNATNSTLNTHTGNDDIHVTTINKSNWDAACEHSQATHARTDATKVSDSTTNGNILINGTETNVYSHPNSGVTAGTYKSVTVNAQGHVTGGSNPTTLSGYGITDAETKSDANAKLEIAKEYTDIKTSGLASSSSVTSSINTHNTSTSAHNDIRDLINGLTTRLNTLANSDDTTLDQMSEIVAYIKNNKTLIDGVTTSKVNINDIVNNLTTNVTNKPLSASQGVAIKGLIDALQTAVDGKVPQSRTVNGKALSSNITLSASDVSAYSKTEIDNKLTNKSDSGHTHAISEIKNLQSTLDSHTHTDATTDASGFMSKMDKNHLKSLATGYSIGSMYGKTITDLKNAFNTWLASYYGISNASASFTADKSWVTLWNNNDTTNTIPAGVRYTVTVVGAYSYYDYVQLRISSYIDKEVYYVAKNNGTWESVRKVAFKDEVNAKQDTITGAATTIADSNLTANRVLISNDNGKVAVSATTSAELGYLSGVTRSVQEQLDGKLSLSGGTNIPTGSDLNNYTTVGIYISGNSSTTSGIVNAPLSGSGFKLFVIDGYISGRVTQFITAANSIFYYRQYNGSVWTDWAKFYDMDKAIAALESSIDGKATKATSLSGYGITDAYTKTQVDNIASGKLSISGEAASAKRLNISAGSSDAERKILVTSESDSGVNVYSINGVTANYAKGTLTASGGFKGNLTGNVTGNADTATQVYTTKTNPSSGTTYHIPFKATSSNSGNSSLLHNDGIGYWTQEGTTSAVGVGELKLGNNIASGTAGNKKGMIYMYGTSTGYTEIEPSNNTTSNTKVVLPSSSGTLALTSHTHNYAGSSSAGGAATSAVKLDSSAGSATQPVYFSGGKPVATTYTLGKSVPSNAVFTDTHYASKNVVGSSSATSNTTSALTNGNVYLNSIENGQVTSTHKISGSGATTVTTDTSGNIIISSTDNNTTYSAAGTSLGLVKSGGDVTISSGVITVNDDSHNHTIANIDNLQSSLDAINSELDGSIKGLSVSGKTITYTKNDGSTGTITTQDTNTTYSNFVKSGSGAKAGLVPAPSTTAGTTKYLREDGTWATPPDTNTVYTHPSYTARTGKPTANQTPAFGGTATVSQITSDATGHVTATTDRTITIPSTLSNGTGTAGLIKTTSTVTSNSGYTACPVINGVPYYQSGSYNPNLLINGNFQVWQRGTSFNQSMSSARVRYTADRWAIYYNDRAFTVRKGDNGGAVTTEALFQVLETPLEVGETYTLSAKVNNEIKTYTFTGGTFSNNGFFHYKDWREHESIHVSVESHTSERTIYWVKLEKGSVATPFIPNIYVDDFNMCQRFYQVHNNLWMRRTSNTVAKFYLPFKMRTAPTVIGTFGQYSMAGTWWENAESSDVITEDNQINVFMTGTADFYVSSELICCDAEYY